MAILLDPYMLWVILAGTVLGVIVGALPGLSGSTTAALLLPHHHHHDAGRQHRLSRRDLLRGQFRRLDHRHPDQHAGRSVRLARPPMTAIRWPRKARPARALGMSTVASAIGGIFSVVVLIVAAPLLARAAYNFGPPEYFALAIFGLSMLAAVGQ